MIELERHIEILLLNNDCVIIPGFGGFMTHHVEARYDDEDNMFLPPLRTLGFNPQLRLNDSLLAQSYIEAYDISYPEAMRRIQHDVEELQQHLDNEGFYELSDIGTLTLNDDGHYEFSPCEAGILTPELYGLYTYEMKPLAEIASAKVVSLQQEIPHKTEREHTEKAITIPIRAIRNTVAACIAVLALLLFPAQNNDNNLSIATNNASSQYIITSMMPKNDVTGKPESVISETKTTLTASLTNITNTAKDVIESHNIQNDRGFTIVMMSHVGKENAEKYIEMLANKQLPEGRILEEEGKALKIVYGNYASYDEAMSALATLKHNHEFAYAWIMETGK